MERERPIAKNLRDKPITIYKGSEKIKECKSIQEAAAFFKEYTQDTHLRFTQIQESYVYDLPFRTDDGVTYYFVSTSEQQIKRRKELENTLERI